MYGTAIANHSALCIPLKPTITGSKNDRSTRTLRHLSFAVFIFTVRGLWKTLNRALIEREKRGFVFSIVVQSKLSRIAAEIT